MKHGSTDVEQDVIISASTVITVQPLCVFNQMLKTNVLTSWSGTTGEDLGEDFEAHRRLSSI